MKPMTVGTRRSTFPTTLLVNGDRHKAKLESFFKTGYELVAENGYDAILAYYPHSSNYVKIVTVEDGKLTSSIKMTPKQLRVLSERVGKKRRKVK